MGLNETDAAILVPTAREDVIDDVIAKTTTARLVVEGANLPTTADARSVLFAQGITVVPDFITNAGGIVAAAHSIGARYSPFTIEPDAVLAMLSRKMRANATSVVRESKAQHLPAHEAALTFGAAAGTQRDGRARPDRRVPHARRGGVRGPA